jgi:hypothetical protein
MMRVYLVVLILKILSNSIEKIALPWELCVQDIDEKV